MNAFVCSFFKIRKLTKDNLFL